MADIPRSRNALDAKPINRILAALSFILAVALLALLPFLFGELMAKSFVKLHLSPEMALTVAMAIIIGGLINIPVKRIVREQEVIVHPFGAFGFDMLLPRFARVRRETIIAINVGGALIPTGLAIYELWHLSALGSSMLSAALYVTVANIIVCYFIARPIPDVGIVMPGFVPPLVAAGLAMIFAPGQAPPVAFIAGVIGPLIGADLLHLRDIRKSAAGIASIGGAGTFDGIVLSGVVAAYLA
jgi:uncharacterized membrane protein